MNFVFISPHFPPQFFHFITALRERGVNVLAIGDSPYEALRQELRESIREYFFTPSLHDYEALLRATGYLTWRHGRIQRIESLNESWLGQEARLREDFNVPGLKPAGIQRLRSKSGMAAVFHEAGIPQPELEIVQSATQVRAFAQRVGYPLVLKPDVGVGAAHTFKVSSDAEVDKVLPQPPHNAFVAQSFVQGTIITYDGVVDREGQILFTLSHQYSDGVMEVVTERRDISFWSLKQIPEALEAMGRKAVAALGLRERWFHLEFFRLPDDRFIVLEANLRPPGGFMTDMINYACDIDVYRLWARAVTGDPVSGIRYTPKYHVCHIARRAGRSYLHTHEEVVRRLGPALMLHNPSLPAVYQGAMGTEMYLTRHEDLERMHEDVRFVQATR
jgi:hypothetical protein